MKALIIYCHPSSSSFNAGILTTIEKCLQKADAELRIIDLYKDGFDPVLGKVEWDEYLTDQPDDALLEKYIEALNWCDSLFFVYPTWWYGPPAILKGWLDRVLRPGVAFEINEGSDIQPKLKHIRNLCVFTTCGASSKLTWLIGAPGKRILMRGVRLLCHWRCRTIFAAHYLMDSSTEQSRELHLQKIEKKLSRFLKV